MGSRLSSLLGLIVGLGLVAALMVPAPDGEELVARGTSALLRGDDGVASEAAPLFEALDSLAAGVAEPSVSLTVLVDGTPTTFEGFRRAFGATLNMHNASRREAEAPPLVLVPSGGTSQVVLEVTADSHVRLVGSVAGTAGEATRVALGWEGEPPGSAGGWRVPGRTALLPPLVAILVALLLRRTLLALFLGILTGSVLLAWQAEPGAGAVLTGFLDVFRVFLWKELVDTFRVEIIGFVVALVAMVGVMSRSGGVQGLVELLLGFARTVRSTLLVTWGMGMLIFFDDYANCLLVGNTMRPLSDRLRISREKLAYIVDSTAAPIAGISLLSTWIAFEVSTYSAHLPAAGITDNAYAIFLQTIPFRYYCLFTLMFVVSCIVLRRDFGPMRKAEMRARTTGQLVREGGTPMVSDEATRIEASPHVPHHWSRGGLPILLVLVATLWWIFKDGGGLELLATDPGALLTLEGITGILYDGSGGKPIFVGASLGLGLAAFLSGSNLLRLGLAVGAPAAWFGAPAVEAWLLDLPAVAGEPVGWGRLVASLAPYLATLIVFTAGALLAMGLGRALPLARTVRPHLPFADIRQASVASLRALFFAVLILFQAWMIGEVCARSHTADYLVALLSGQVSPVLLPVILFLASCLVAFATGSSWSTMSILLPNVVALAATVGESAELGALGMVVLCIGAVLEGSIFGDHCSPISDTTVLSSVSSASDHVDHVRTQAPYALTTGALAIFVGYIPTVLFDWWTTPLALGAGFVGVVTALLVLGRPVPESVPDAGHVEDGTDGARLPSAAS